MTVIGVKGEMVTDSICRECRMKVKTWLKCLGFTAAGTHKPQRWVGSEAERNSCPRAMGGRDADYEEFLALRKHVRKLQQGTPLLLNTLGGQDDLQICSLAWKISRFFIYH